MDLFDVIGPVMVGPSSSHTAGAARIGKITRRLLGCRPVCAKIGLYGSFQKTYLGHGTDKALIGGLLGMNVDDLRLRNSLEIAGKRGWSIRSILPSCATPIPIPSYWTWTGKTGGI